MDEAAVHALVDEFHRAAANADADAYFGAMTPDAVFVGTDASERWTRDEFRSYAAAAFEREAAWVYEPTKRHVTIADDATTAWFDEQLASASYKHARGSGVVVATSAGPRIAHYVLSFPIPNESVPAMLQLLYPTTQSDLH